MLARRDSFPEPDPSQAPFFTKEFQLSLLRAFVLGTFRKTGRYATEDEVNEFMAWALSARLVNDMLEQAAANKLNVWFDDTVGLPEFFQVPLKNS